MKWTVQGGEKGLQCQMLLTLLENNTCGYLAWSHQAFVLLFFFREGATSVFLIICGLVHYEC